VAIAILICRTVYKKGKVAHHRGGVEMNERSNVNETDDVANEAALQAANNGGVDDTGIAEVDIDLEFVEEEALRPPMKESPESSTVSELEIMAQKHAEEIEYVKLSTEAKMKIRQRKISRLETAAEIESAKAADLTVKLVEAKQEAESKASHLVEVTQNQDYLQAKVAELTEELGRLQDNRNMSIDDAASEDEDSQLPRPSTHKRRATTAIPKELLKDLLGDSTAPGNKEGGAASDDDPRARVLKATEIIGGAGNVRVAVRVRPPNQRELAGEGNSVCLDVLPADGIIKVGGEKAFAFDLAFSMETSQAEVFDNLGVDLVGWVLGGYNARACSRTVKLPAVRPTQ